MAGHDDDNERATGGNELPVPPSVPGADIPSPIPGIDWQTFRNFVVRALGGDESVPPAIRTRVNAALQGGETELEKKDRQWWQDFILRQAIDAQLRKIDELIDQYREMAAWHHEQAEQARARMQEAADRLAEIETFIDGANEIFKDKERTGKFDRNEAIRLLKARGVAVAGDEPEEALMRKLTIETAKAREERLKWSEQYDRSKTDADLNDQLEQEDLRKARELVEKRDAIRGGGYGAEEEEQRLKETAEEYEADVRRKAFELEKQKSYVSNRELMADAQRDIDNSQTVQTESQASDFEAWAAGALKGEFKEVAANIIKTDPQIPPPKGPAQGGPFTSV